MATADDCYPEDKLKVGDEVVLKTDKEALSRTIIQVAGHFYKVAGVSGVHTINDFSVIKRKSDILNEDRELSTSFREQQIKVTASLASKTSYTLQNLPVYESMLIHNFGHVLRLPEGYVFASRVTFIPTTKEIL